MANMLRILLVEDAPTDAALVEECLREAGLAFDARRVETRDEYKRALKDFAPDLILADHTLPAFDALGAVRIAAELAPLVPIIVVTGTLPDERAVDVLRAGARDYILKDRLARLAPAVRRALEEARAAAQLRATDAELRKQLDELRRFQKAAVDRELRMKELKDENRRLREQLAAREKA